MHTLVILGKESLVVLVLCLQGTVYNQLTYRLGHILQVHDSEALAVDLHVPLLSLFGRQNVLSLPLRLCDLWPRANKA